MEEGIIQSDVAAVIQPRILFKPGSWLTKIDFINHLILFNNVLITVLSEKEGGKTSFGALLQMNLDQQIKSVSIKIKPSCSRENIISEIATQFHLNHDANTDLSSIVAQINESKAHVLLMIDDAQHLPESLIQEAMQAIKNQESFGFFHLCLISDYSIVATLDNLVASLFENLVHTIEVGTLNETEMRTYVLQRAMAAHLISKPLTEAQFKQFYQLTKGNLAKINNSLEEFVLKCSNQKKKDPMNTVKKISYAASVVFIAGLAGFYFSQSYDISSFFHLKTVAAPAQNENVITTVMKPQEQPKLLVSYIASWENSSTRQLVFSSVPTKQVSEDFDDEMPTNTVAIVDKVVVIPKIKVKNLAKKEPAKKEPEKIKTNAALGSKLIKTAGIPHKKPNNPISATLYTIQIAASHNKKDIELFKQKNKLLADTAKLRHFTNAKGTWYVLTIGEYESKSKAHQGISKLPVTLEKLNPWVRPVSNFG